MLDHFHFFNQISYVFIKKNSKLFDASITVRNRFIEHIKELGDSGSESLKQQSNDNAAKLLRINRTISAVRHCRRCGRSGDSGSKTGQVKLDTVSPKGCRRCYVFRSCVVPALKPQRRTPPGFGVLPRA